MIFRNILWTVAGFLTLNLCSCSSNLADNGSATNTGNARVSGKLVDTLNIPVRNAEVVLLPAAFDPRKDGSIPDSLSTLTDGSGTYVLHTPIGGYYNLEAKDSSGRTTSLLAGISILSNKSSELPENTLRQPGSLKIQISSADATTDGYAYLPGTTRFGRILNGFVFIDSVPTGFFPEVHLVYTADSLKKQVVKTDITIHSNETTRINDLGAWAYSKKFTLNTTSSGANVAGTIRNFPVLIRLTKNNFNFTQAMHGGEDIRFSKLDGTPLAYEIERFDQDSSVAEIWVKVDTIYGNNNTQSFSMHWGNSSALPGSNGAAVFDTGTGFVGVWHLNGNALDATGNQNGMNHGSIRASGIVGNAQKFSGSDTIEIPGHLGSPQVVSLSAWAQLDSNKGGELISIGGGAIIRTNESRLGYGIMGTFANPNLSYSDIPSGFYAEKSVWHFIEFTVDAINHKQSLFIDGLLLGSGNDSAAINYSTKGDNTRLGIYNGPAKSVYNFIGKIDEARVSKIAHSADWIKLCYMNQKETDLLVVDKVGP